MNPNQPGSSQETECAVNLQQLVVDEPNSFLPLGHSMCLGEGFGISDQDQTNMGVHNEVPKQGFLEADSSFESVPSRQAIPRRNLTEAFEELYVEPSSVEVATPATKDTIDFKGSSEVSPTGVADIERDEHSSSRESQDLTSDPHGVSEDASVALSFEHADESTTDELPHFCLHASLQRDLSQALLNRVSFYGVIHDINKEANSMATSDTSSFARSCGEEAEEEFSPLVIAINGAPSRPMSSASMMDAAVIDEEKWLLAAIESRGDDESRSVAACPPTFLQAMGEREYDNPLSSMESSRTQLWKPSRSWWEAKSGKNPWIEPTSHNKRWRYLWPLIHYHKFLAKCIKKLKRNGVDVKTSVSPVAVFLREEVCAVSDHLASVSLFTSEEWTDCLVHFNGWTDHSPKAEKRLRMLVSRLSLRPLAEPGDVDSPLLRSQVDEHFLRAMASAREQMTNGGIQQERTNQSKSAALERDQAITDAQPERKANGLNSRNKIPLHPQRQSSALHPMAAPYPMPNHMANQSPTGDGQHWGYTGLNGHWWANGWPYYAYTRDESSVQSGLSGDTFHQYGDYGVYAGANGAYYPAPQDQSEYYYSYGQAGGYHQYQANPGMAAGWMGYPPVGDPHVSEGSGYVAPGTPRASPQNYNFYHQYSPSNLAGSDQTPHKSSYKHDPKNPSSPYWAHLDQSTLAMTGLCTPQHGNLPETPLRGRNEDKEEETGEDTTPEKTDARKLKEDFAVNAKPLLINTHSQYYHHGLYGAREGYVPPSPATQFMMSPQANAQAAAYYAHAYGSGAYGVSPGRHGWRQPHDAKNTSIAKQRLSPDKAGDKPMKAEDVTPPPMVRKVTERGERVTSPATVQTVETMAESESIVET